MGCIKCMSRIPYATLIATIMCFVGVAVFCGTMYRGATYTYAMFQNVFQVSLPWLEHLHLAFWIIAGSMGGLGLILLIVGFLATGATREKIYKGWKARVGGRISCALFMIFAYVLSLVWVLVFAVLTVLTFVYVMLYLMCASEPVKTLQRCIDLTSFEFLFPNGTQHEQMTICGQNAISEFCTKYVEPAQVMFVLATIAAFLVIISLVHYLMCLSSNYSRIKDNEKFQDLQDLQYLHESMSTLPKERF